MTTKQFNKLSKKKQRILIAEDVIKQVQAEKYKSSPGTYVNIEDAPLSAAVEDGQDVELCKMLDKVEKCEVCARGAIFLSGVRLGNKFSINQLELNVDGLGVGYREMKAHTSEIFPRKDQIFLETVFEGYDVNGELNEWLDMDNEEEVDKFFIKLEKFHKNHPDDNERLIKIMKNIIKNDGTFKF